MKKSNKKAPINTIKAQHMQHKNANWMGEILRIDLLREFIRGNALGFPGKSDKKNLVIWAWKRINNSSKSGNQILRSREAKWYSGSGGATAELGDRMGGSRTLNCEVQLG